MTIRFHAFKTSPDSEWGSIESMGRAVIAVDEMGYDAFNLPEHFIFPHDERGSTPPFDPAEPIGARVRLWTRSK